MESAKGNKQPFRSAPEQHWGGERNELVKNQEGEGNDCPENVWGTKTILKMPLAGEPERPWVKSRGSVCLAPLSDDARSRQPPHNVASGEPAVSQGAGGLTKGPDAKLVIFLRCCRSPGLESVWIHQICAIALAL